MQIPLKSLIVFLFAVFISCSSSSVKSKKETPTTLVSISDTCDGPDSDINCCFVNTPESITHVMKIGGDNESGEKLIISGTVFKKDGITPVKDIIIYAYQTNDKGIYAKAGNETGVQKWHGTLHGWCKTNAEGKYEIHSIRPASYPNSSAPAHIHAAIKLPGGGEPFYIKDYVFDDDPFVNANFRSQSQYGEGSSGIVSLRKKDDIWYGVRNIVLTR